MSPNLIIGIVGVVLLLGLIFMGTHIAVALGTVGLGGLILIMGFNGAINMAASTAYAKIATFTNAAVPMFILMGMLASSLGVSGDAYMALKRLVGRRKGGLGIATVLASAAFGTLNGSGVVTASVFTKAAVPPMLEAGYDKKTAYGVVCGSANLGQLIPPSLTAIMLGAATGISIGQLLTAILVPGVLVILFNCTYMVLHAIRHPEAAPTCKDKYTWKEKIIGLKDMIPVAVSAIVIIGGLSGGIFSSTECGAFGCVVFVAYAAIKRVPFKKILEGLSETVKSVSMIFILMVSASLFALFLNVSGVAGTLTNFLVAHNFPNWLFLLMTMLILLVMGCFMDASGMLFLVVPILYPVSVAMGIAPLQFALVVMVSMLLGALTPPVGLVCFTVKGLAGDEIELSDIFKGAFPYMITVTCVILVLIFFPGLSTIFASVG